MDNSQNERVMFIALSYDVVVHREWKHKGERVRGRKKKKKRTETPEYIIDLCREIRSASFFF